MIVVMMMNFGFEYRSGFAMAGQVAKIDAGEDVLGRADGGGREERADQLIGPLQRRERRGIEFDVAAAEVTPTMPTLSVAMA